MTTKAKMSRQQILTRYISNSGNGVRIVVSNGLRRTNAVLVQNVSVVLTHMRLSII